MNSNINNSTSKNDVIYPDDATWILTSAFIIFTMQSGFGLLEAGLVSKKNESNIMVKNAVDVIYGGLSYWLFGFAFSFGIAEGSNPFCGIGYFMTDTADDSQMGELFAKYFFQVRSVIKTYKNIEFLEAISLACFVFLSF